MKISNPLLPSSVFVCVVCCIITIVAADCTNTNVMMNNNCKTKISGNCIIDPSFKFNFSAIIIKEYGNQKLIPGTIISNDINGVLFKADEGYYKGENKLYKYKNIICVIDTNHKAIYGTIPEEYYHSWKTMLRLTNAKTGIDQYLTFEPNQPFELCIHPGIYRLTELQISSGKQTDAKRKFYNPITLVVHENKVNKLGTVYVDADTVKGDTLQFECLTEYSEFDERYTPDNPIPVTSSLPVTILSSAAMAFNKPIIPVRLPIYHKYTIVPDVIHLNDSNITSTKFIRGNY